MSIFGCPDHPSIRHLDDLPNLDGYRCPVTYNRFAIKGLVLARMDPSCEWHPDGCPAADPGRSFFVSVVKPGTRDWRALAGPYATHRDALDKVSAAEKLADRDPRAAFYAFGTVQAPSDTATIFGRI